LARASAGGGAAQARRLGRGAAQAQERGRRAEWLGSGADAGRAGGRPVALKRSWSAGAGTLGERGAARAARPEQERSSAGGAAAAQAGGAERADAGAREACAGARRPEQSK
jgi:hypothetical protein